MNEKQKNKQVFKPTLAENLAEDTENQNICMM